MQEEVEQKTLALIINTGKLTGRQLMKSIMKLQAHLKDKKNHPKIPQGKQSVKNLAKQGQGVSSLDMNDADVKMFDRIMKKYGVDYSVVTDKKTNPPTHTIFFKAKDADAITKAFAEFTAQATKKATRPSVLTQLRSLAELVKNTARDKVKNKNKERTR